jgi:hypothetical protein
VVESKKKGKPTPMMSKRRTYHIGKLLLGGFQLESGVTGVSHTKDNDIISTREPRMMAACNFAWMRRFNVFIKCAYV